MVNSFEELEQLLGITPVNTEWGREFPFDAVMNVYKSSQIGKRILAFIKKAKGFGLNTLSFVTIHKLGMLADSEGLILAYFVTSPTHVHLFFYPQCTTDKWMSQFKEHTTRRMFFDYIRTYKQTKTYEPLPNSLCYQILNTMVPSEWNLSSMALGDKYILSKITSDFEPTKLKVYKITDDGLVDVDYTVKYHPTTYNHIELHVENNVFIGTSFTLLWDGVESVETSDLEASTDTQKMILNPETGIVQVFDYAKFERRFYTIPKFGVKKNCCIIRKLPDNNLLLNNGWVWNTEKNTFKNISTLLPNQDIKILNLSSSSKWVVLSPQRGFIELLEEWDFVKLLDSIPETVMELNNIKKA